MGGMLWWGWSTWKGRAQRHANVVFVGWVASDGYGGRERGGRVGRLPGERGGGDLSDYPLIPHGRVFRRVVGERPEKRLGNDPADHRDAERRRGGGGGARDASSRGAGDDVYRVAGPAADDPEHVQD